MQLHAMPCLKKEFLGDFSDGCEVWRHVHMFVLETPSLGPNIGGFIQNIECLYWLLIVCWAQGIRTVVAMDAYPTEEQRRGAAEAEETWVFYPNDLPKRSAYSGDTRWALTPFLAHQVAPLIAPLTTEHCSVCSERELKTS